MIKKELINFDLKLWFGEDYKAVTRDGREINALYYVKKENKIHAYPAYLDEMCTYDENGKYLGCPNYEHHLDLMLIPPPSGIILEIKRGKSFWSGKQHTFLGVNAGYTNNGRKISYLDLPIGRYKLTRIE